MANNSNENPNRIVPPLIALSFLRSMSEAIGPENLELILMRTGLARFVSIFEGRKIVEMHASEWAALQREVRIEYGEGAAQLLRNAGHNAWRWLVRESSLTRQVELRQAQDFPVSIRRLRSIQFLANQMRLSGNGVTVFSLGQDLIFMDAVSDTTWGANLQGLETIPTCWSTIGMIEAALIETVAKEYIVEEMTCKGMGALHCQFRIREKPETTL